MSANESPNERHKQNSNPNPTIELEPSLQKGRAERADPNPRTSAATERTYPLGMVLSACPDIVDYAKGGIANWRDFLATAAVVRPMLGISPSAWEEATNRGMCGRGGGGDSGGLPAAAKLYDSISRWLFARTDVSGRAGRVPRSDPFSLPKLTPRTASGDPPEGIGCLTVRSGAVSFQTSIEGEFRSDAHRS